MNFFRKYAVLVFFFLAILVQIRAPFIPMGIVKNLFYGFFFLSAFFIFIQIITNPKIFLHPAFRILLLVWLTYLIYMILFDHSYDGLAYVIFKGIFFSSIAISVYYYSEYYIKKFPYFIVMSATIIFFIGFFIHPIYSTRYESILGNPNTVGFLGALAFGILLLSEKLDNKKIVLLLFLLAMVFLSGSRNGLIGIGLALLIRDISIKSILTIILIVSFIIIINTIATEHGITTGLNRVIESRGGLTSRELTNLYGYKTLLLSPMTGSGLDKYAYISSKLIPIQLEGILVPNPHNSFLGLFIQMGIPFGIIILSLLFYYLLRILFYKPRHKVLLFMIYYTFIASTFESFLFSVSGFEGYVFWISLSIYMMYIYKISVTKHTQGC